ncbi:MAG TPA: DUF3368 domain-containing protein, partial [Lamprocystis sp. (in: g-proteobacteria)]|nr:DUF3368 domain-containing protein [Lamprocystis sp. (in: g-proteobacteria)]
MTFCNTTPLIALSGIGRLDLLPRLFGTIHLTESVVAECAAGGPIAVPNLLALPWTVIVPADAPTLPGLLLNLDRGERDTLAMARKLGAERVIIDERIGRDMAELLGLPVVGTLGVLLKARELGLLPSFRAAVTRMQRNG